MHSSSDSDGEQRIDLEDVDDQTVYENLLDNKDYINDEVSKSRDERLAKQKVMRMWIIIGIASCVLMVLVLAVIFLVVVPSDDSPSKDQQNDSSDSQRLTLSLVVNEQQDSRLYAVIADYTNIKDQLADQVIQVAEEMDKAQKWTFTVDKMIEATSGDHIRVVEGLLSANIVSFRESINRIAPIELTGSDRMNTAHISGNHLEQFFQPSQTYSYNIIW
eukprot:CAMPEP_0201551922 /NCGR_PEP_ID=MMETSP0173_2-20130828/12144_1 /ASSEMBLY_ACC=CAM_ASM_000268 /TAXON_ID=218659 /ORGANISM="Vexillifera sp., Strain DIVA3 564/2" /LENGTH=217 /DNA_ID=CAMNT_0047962293 /DNA_START=21 /DNA_END=671 /DNA_ORIENTATION=+